MGAAGTIRDLTVAAPLKLSGNASGTSLASTIRDLTVAAPLKLRPHHSLAANCYLSAT